MISISTYKPAKLKDYIKYFWRLEVTVGIDQGYVEEIVPDGHPEIVFHLQSPGLRKNSFDKEWQKEPMFFISGQKRNSYLQKLEPGTIIYAIRFHPHTLPLLYNYPAWESTDSLIKFTDLCSSDQLVHCITESGEETFRNFERVCTERIARLENTSTAFLYVDAAVKKIIKHQGVFRIEELEKLTGVSSRYLEKSFLQYVGLSPKQFSGIIRFNSFINYQKNNPGRSLTDCSYEMGFHDQSHLIRLSKLITGKSPKSYFLKENRINDFFLRS